MGTPRSPWAVLDVTAEGVVPWENIGDNGIESPGAPISQMAKLRLREAGDLPTSGWWRGKTLLQSSPSVPQSLLWAGGRGRGSHLSGWGGVRDLTSVGWVEERVGV